jgi:Rrf2 family protein
VHIANQEPHVQVPSHDIARANRIPKRFLLKVLKPLVAAGVLVSVKGPHGGYRLARPATQITMLDIVEAVDGPIRAHNSFQGRSGNEVLEKRLHQVCLRVNESLRKQLKSVRLLALCSNPERLAVAARNE